jgi:hypothetical protein
MEELQMVSKPMDTYGTYARNPRRRASWSTGFNDQGSIHYSSRHLRIDRDCDSAGIHDRNSVWTDQ